MLILTCDIVTASTGTDGQQHHRYAAHDGVEAQLEAAPRIGVSHVAGVALGATIVVAGQIAGQVSCDGVATATNRTADRTYVGPRKDLLQLRRRVAGRRRGNFP